MSTKKREGRKISLDDEAVKNINSALISLRAKSCRLGHSQLASFAINVFFEKYYKKEVKNFEQSFFSEKAYLKNIVSGSEDLDELTNSLGKFLKRVKQTQSSSTKAEDDEQ